MEQRIPGDATEIEKAITSAHSHEKPLLHGITGAKVNQSPNEVVIST